MKIETKSLPDSIKNALKQVGYGSNDISVEVVEKSNLRNPAAFEGNRGYAILVNLETGETKVTWGSWGGSNMFVQTIVDDCEQEFDLPHNCAVIKGESGGRGNYAHLYLHPSNTVPGLLCAPVIDKETYHALNPHRYIGIYKKEMMAAVKSEDTEKAISAGYLTKKGRGIGLTTEGKNAIEAFEKINGKY